MARTAYAIALDGSPVQAPKGWRILPEGSDIPQAHREFIRVAPYGRDTTWREVWASPRRCHSTMTPFYAGVSGGVIAFAAPIEEPQP